MIVAALVFSACLALISICWAIALRYFSRRILGDARSLINEEHERIRTELYDIVNDFVAKPDDKTPSKLGVFVDELAILFAARFMQQIKTSLQGIASGESKNESGETLDMLASQNPLGVLASALLPKRLRNKLLTNPQFVGALGGLMRGGNHSPTSTPTRIHRE